MAYARYSPISDVYVYLNMDNLYVCQNCPLNNTNDFLTTTPKQMIHHLLHHHTLKHRIPHHTMYHLQQEYK